MQVDRLAVEVELHAVRERRDRHRRGRIRLLRERRPHDGVDDVVLQQHRARVRLRDDPRARRPEHEVAVGVVVVPMRVDREVDVLAAELADRGEIARHELGKLRVDGQHAVRADRDGDVAAEPEQHVEIVADLLGADLGRRELLGRDLRKARRRRRRPPPAGRSRAYAPSCAPPPGSVREYCAPLGTATRRLAVVPRVYIEVHGSLLRVTAMNVGSGIAIGIGIGVAIGAAMGNVGVGIAIGAGIGVVLGAARGGREQDKPPPDKPPPK